MDQFVDRTAAGRQLAELLTPLQSSSPIVLAMPRGGVPVAVEVARALGAPLGVVLSRKLSLPGNPEYGVGAVAQGGSLYLDETALERHKVPPDQMQAAIARELGVIDLQAARFIEGQASCSVAGRTALIVDDGVATGATARAAASAVRQGGAKRLVLATPVCPPEVIPLLRRDFETVVCVKTPTPFDAVGLWYRDFRQLSDEDAVAMLAGYRNEHSG